MVSHVLKLGHRGSIRCRGDTYPGVFISQERGRSKGYDGCKGPTLILTDTLILQVLNIWKVYHWNNHHLLQFIFDNDRKTPFSVHSFRSSSFVHERESANTKP